ncbi:MAG: D-alanine--D-alanine ligase [Desulfobacterales bacterium]|jgi:D-alanine-D-alanine ligase|nr:D-alanine--D-alanine ligase [Desulfobacterales bacterium]
MKIGMTYDLRADYLAAGYDELETAEFDREDTIDALEAAIRRLGYTTDRIGDARRLIERLTRGNRWDLVFNIAEGINGIGREAQVPAILDLYNIPYTFSDPLVMSLTLHKGLTKRVIRDARIPTSDFCVVEKESDKIPVSFPPPFFIKPVAEGTGKGVSPQSILHHDRDLIPACGAMLRTYRQPVLVERYLSGREFTVGILGTGTDAEVLGTIEVILLSGAEKGVYSYVNKEKCEELVQYRPVRSTEELLVRKAEDIALDAWRVLGCRDAGRVDIRCDEFGRPFFLEVNPLAGLHPDHSDLPIICKGIPLAYEVLIERILASALMRIKGNRAL